MQRALSNAVATFPSTLANVNSWLLSRATPSPAEYSVLCDVLHRPPCTVLHNTQRIVVIDGVVDTTNIGAIFRSAAALGVDAVLLTPSSCDPLNRRSIRVSMGSTFLVPWTWVTPPLTCLHDYGFTTAAMALTDDSLALGDPRLHQYDRLALIMGTEGDGLSAQTIAEADLVVRIPMSHQVDSLNVAGCSGCCLLGAPQAINSYREY